ncbi:glycoside hydrolase family 3 N-terminal domain-containing protein [Synechococcus sp. PCC 7336]|uniref:glycoside hydrolase family 3 N-terminal domain-containing protein n=1 Tax=Synechococcus sp. PCC 7336 TaxID=195250 RepID=UPI0003454515|nr:glycoside hydrolase family 3 N-terminal domain-containing protein [Synechococcus sp. PCC 7336]
MALTLQQQVAQMIVVRASGHLLDSQAGYPQWEWPREQLEPLIRQTGIGGVLLFGGTVADVALRIQQMQDWANLPLLVCADVEAGVGQRFAGGTKFPPAIAFSTLGERGVQWARQMGQIVASEAAALGINWLLAPVVDVQSNPDNPVIDIRAFGREPEQVSALAAAFIAGAQSAPVLTTAKHFPGHGDTSIDSHLNLPTLLHNRDRLEAVEWMPFQRAIAAGVSTIMSAHLMVPALDERWPASLSPAILNDVIRQQWHFSGPIVTDAMTMGAIANYPNSDTPLSGGELAVRAVEAGADIILMPPDPQAAITAICAAVENGQLSRQRIQQSLERILQAKHKVCDPKRMAPPSSGDLLSDRAIASPAVQPSPPAPLPLLADKPLSTSSSLNRLLVNTIASNTISGKTVTSNRPDSQILASKTAAPRSSATLCNIVSISNSVGTPSARQCANEIARAAIVSIRSENLPLQPEPNWLNWMWSDRWLGANYLSPTSPAIAAATAHSLPTLLADLDTPLSILTDALDRASGLVVQLFVQAGPFRGFGGLPPTAQHLLVERWEKVKAIVVYGSRSCSDRLTALSEPYDIPCLYAGDRRDIAQAEVASKLWGQAFVAPEARPEA